jgi:hypothetical protein
LFSWSHLTLVVTLVTNQFSEVTIIVTTDYFFIKELFLCTKNRLAGSVFIIPILSLIVLICGLGVHAEFKTDKVKLS